MTLSWLNICVSTIIIKMEYNTLEVMKIIKSTIERNKNITIILKTENDIYFRTILLGQYIISQVVCLNSVCVSVYGS